MNALKIAFRDWCGLLSIDEIVSNPALSNYISQIEAMFLRGA